MSDPTNTEPVERLSEAWWAARSPEIRARRCSAHRRNGDQCAKVAMEAQKVCGTHGGRAPQAKAKARQRLDEAQDRMARALLGIAEGAESEAVKLAAVKHVLAIGGLSEKHAVEVEVSVQPWEELLGDVAHVTKAQHEAMKRGEPLPPTPPPALPASADDIVDAEVVEDTPERVGERADRPTVPDWAEPPPAAPPSRELVTMEEAAADVAAANRTTRFSKARRRR